MCRNLAQVTSIFVMLHRKQYSYDTEGTIGQGGF